MATDVSPDGATFEEKAKRPLHMMIVPILVAVALVIALRSLSGSENTIDRFGNASPGLLTAAAVALAGYWLLTVSSWSSVVALATNVSIPLSDSLAQIVTVNLGKYVPGKVWGLMARGSLMTRHDIDTRGVVRASLLEQFYLLLTAACIAGGAWGLDERGLFGAGVMVVAVTVLALSLLVPHAFIGIWNSVAGRIRPGAQISLDPPTPRVSAVLILRYCAIWLLLGLSFAALAFSLTSLSVTIGNTSLLVFANTVAYVAGFLALFAPGGLGIRESVGAALLAAPLGLTEAAFVFVAFRLIIVLGEIAASLLAFPRLVAAFRE